MKILETIRTLTIFKEYPNQSSDRKYETDKHKLLLKNTVGFL